MQRAHVFVIAAAAVFLSSIPATSSACGESLFRVGKGVAYRAYSAPIPANIVVYVETDEQRDFARQLADSGHEVLMTADAAELERLLAQADYDVVVAPYSGWETVSRNEFAAAHYIPVVEADAGTKDKQFDQRLLLDGNLKIQLRTIHAKLVASS